MRLADMPRYERILLKLSGEVMAGSASFGIEAARVEQLAAEIAEVARSGVQIGLVVGGGNFFRGVAEAARRMDRVTADQMGMLATVINALALQDALERLSTPTRVMTAIAMQAVAEPYIRRRAIRHMEKGRVVILAAGTGNPYFTTDTAAALRALELDADILLMGKNRVDGIYSADPRQDPTARRFIRISHKEALQRNLRVMDASAFSLCRENNLPILVFNMNEDGAIERAVQGEPVGTLVAAGETQVA